jgi:hypothetical protein
MTVQNEIQKEVLKDTMGANGMQKQLLSLLSSPQPQQTAQKTAQEQIQKGYLDIKI